MSYLVLARKWRPQNFDQLVGQVHISQTLLNAAKNNRMPHALLFTGPRGTGKTSSARILAKSLRCQNLNEFQPCNQCQDCLDISVGRSVDVLEIDGASHNGVDAIRELRETVGFLPSSGEYKIFIIDEVHMLSTSAFNALLKTLEEPPAHVVFILATTEVHKIPQTILSRCQRFDFRKISTKLIADHLLKICQSENFSITEEALWLIARRGDGSMRDSQSLLDQVISFSTGKIDLDQVSEILGLIHQSLIDKTLEALFHRSVEKLLLVFADLKKTAHEPILFLELLLENLRHVLLIQYGAQSSDMVELPDSEIRYLKSLSTSTTPEDLYFLFDMALKGSWDLQKTSEPYLVLEMILLRMTHSPQMRTLEQLFGQQGSLVAPQPSPAIAQPQPPPPPLSLQQTSQAARAHAAPGPLNSEKWLDFVQQVKTKDALLFAKVENAFFISATESDLQLGVSGKMSFLKDQLLEAQTLAKLKLLMLGFFQRPIGFSLKISNEPPAAPSAHSVEQEKKATQQKNIMDEIQKNPKVMAVADIFKGQIKSVKTKEI